MEEDLIFEIHHTLNKNSSFSRPDPDAIWLVGPLIAKLPSQVQGRVLKLSGHVLESGNNFQSKGRDKERSQRRLVTLHSVNFNDSFEWAYSLCLFHVLL